MTAKSIKLLIADDHALLRSGLRMPPNAQPDMEVIAEASDGSEAVSQAVALRPTVVLMDVAMSGESGLEATWRIKERRRKFESCCEHVR